MQQQQQQQQQREKEEEKDEDSADGEWHEVVLLPREILRESPSQRWGVPEAVEPALRSASQYSSSAGGGELGWSEGGMYWMVAV